MFTIITCRLAPSSATSQGLPIWFWWKTVWASWDRNRAPRILGWVGGITVRMVRMGWVELRLGWLELRLGWLGWLGWLELR